MNAYIKLVTKFPLVPIRNLVHLKSASAIIDELLDRDNLLPEEKDYYDVLVDQMVRFEEKMFPAAKTTPLEMIRGLMAVNNLKSIDLVPLFGTKSIVSEVLSGKRQLSKRHIANLSAHFSLSPAAFLPAQPDIKPAKKLKSKLKNKTKTSSAVQLNSKRTKSVRHMKKAS